jgi:formylglycine-generating enzyme required for sulfatase activity
MVMGYFSNTRIAEIIPMSTTSLHRLVILLLISMLLVSCGSSDNSSPATSGTGISFQLKWPVAKTAGSAPAGVTTVRMSVSGPGMTIMTQDFIASDGKGTINNVPVGNSRTITFQGLNAGSTVLYEAIVPNVTLVKEQTFDCGLVTMKNSVPITPASINATAISSSQINLVWTDSADNETSYRVERKTGAGGTYAPLTTLAANATFYIDFACAPTTTYFYRVIAVNGIGDSVNNSEASATTPEITYSISGTITSGGVGLAGVTVTLTGDGATSTTTGNSGTYSFSGARNGAYTLTASVAGYAITPATLAAPVNSANLTGMNLYASVNTAPVAPSGLSAAPVSTSQINLAWKDNANNEAGYQIERKVGTNGTYVPVGTAAANAESFNDLSLAQGTTYFYRIRATNNIGTSEYSAEASATTSSIATSFVPTLIQVPAGSYTMGSGTSPVSVGAFSIGKHEVTQDEWYKVMQINPSNFTKCGFEQETGLGCPVEQVSWNDVQEFITRLNQLSGKSNEPLTKKYRLPTDAEWEYAARSGGLDQKYSGSDIVGEVAWYLGNAGGVTHNVCSSTLKANGLGICDMSGNVWEWIGDPYDGISRVIRGGSWTGASTVQLTTYRAYFAQSLSNNSIGFRLAITNP